MFKSGHDSWDPKAWIPTEFFKRKWGFLLQHRDVTDLGGPQGRVVEELEDLPVSEEP
jgi:hypothetical protein